METFVLDGELIVSYECLNKELVETFYDSGKIMGFTKHILKCMEPNKLDIET